MPTIQSFFRRIHKKDASQPPKHKAQGLVEFALVLPILLLLVLGIIEFGRLLFVYASVTSASREGARYGSAVGQIGGTSRYADCTGIRDAAKRVGFFAGVEDANVTITYDDGTNQLAAACPPGVPINLADRINVTVAITYTPMVPLVPLPSFPIASTTARTIIKDVGIRGTPPPTPTPPNSPGMPTLSGVKRDILDFDADANGYVSPGDRIQYVVVISNNGTGPSNGVVFYDVPDANTDLVVGSVSTTQGTVNVGNSSGDTAVDISIGTVAAGTNVTIIFDVTIVSPFPGGIDQISNQGQITSTEFPTFATDDPDTGTGGDATITSVVPSYAVAAVKVDDLEVDADNNGVVSPGDTIRYTIGVANLGNGMLTGINFVDTPDANTTLVVGSVTTTAGSVVTGNGTGDTTVEVDLGSLIWGGNLVVTFDVTVNSPFPDTITEVVNQGTVDTNETSSVVTDDPALGGTDDPTVTNVQPSADTPTPTATVPATATPLPTATATPTPTPTPACSIIFDQFTVNHPKISWRMTNNGPNVRISQIELDFHQNNDNLIVVAFGTTIWSGSKPPTAIITEAEWLPGSETDRLLTGGGAQKTLSFTFDATSTIKSNGYDLIVTFENNVCPPESISE